MKQTMATGLAAVLVVAMTAAACGGGSSSSTPSTPTSPTTPTTPPTTGTPTDTATITIGSTGAVSPSSVTITRGGRVTFVNNDSRAHDMASDPHPEHSTCTEINSVGFLSAGQSRTTANMNTARTCTYHDHNLPADRGLQGSIIIQ